MDNLEKSQEKQLVQGLIKTNPCKYLAIYAIIPKIRKDVHKKKEEQEVINPRPSLTAFIVDKIFFIFSTFHKGYVSYWLAEVWNVTYETKWNSIKITPIAKQVLGMI